METPGYTYGTAVVARSPLTLDEFAQMKQTALFSDDDVQALRASRALVEHRVEEILDVWYGFVGSTPHLLAYFGDPETGQPIPAYLAAVRKRFGQWILDTCRAEYGASWLAWQEEIGRRHHRVGKNKADGVAAAAHVPLRYLLALIVPISVTMKPFLAKKGASATDVDAMHAAWTKAVLLQAILWARPYVKEGDF